MVAHAKANPVAPLTVLVVDDDDDCRMLLRDAIAECGRAGDVQVIEARDGHEAMEYLRQSPASPNLIYLDVEMPRLDGMATLREIRSDPRLRGVPVVMMTGVADDAQMSQAAAAGANSYTLKPACGDEFLRTVRASTFYWLTVHQYPDRHLPAGKCRR